MNHSLGLIIDVVDDVDDLDQDRLDELRLAPSPCPVCGSTTVCGYDSEGEPLIHAVREDEGQP